MQMYAKRQKISKSKGQRKSQRAARRMSPALRQYLGLFGIYACLFYIIWLLRTQLTCRP